MSPFDRRHSTAEVFGSANDPDADDFQNLISSFSSKDISLVKFLSRSQHSVRKAAIRHRQIDKRRVKIITFLAEKRIHNMTQCISTDQMMTVNGSGDVDNWEAREDSLKLQC